MDGRTDGRTPGGTKRWTKAWRLRGRKLRISAKDWYPRRRRWRKRSEGVREEGYSEGDRGPEEIG